MTMTVNLYGMKLRLGMDNYGRRFATLSADAHGNILKTRP